MHSSLKNRTSSLGVNFVKEDHKKYFVLDAFCGCGGNTIAFAKSQNMIVIAVDIDRSKLYFAAANCAIYEISPDAVIFIEGDVYEVLRHYTNGDKISFESRYDTPNQETYMGYTIGGFDLLPSSIDGVFLSPPWGGPEYSNKMTFTLQDIKIFNTLHSRRSNDDLIVTCNGFDLLKLSLNASVSKTVLYFLPRNVDGERLGHDALSTGYQGQVELEQQILHGKLKTVTAYFNTDLNM